MGSSRMFVVWAVLVIAGRIPSGFGDSQAELESVNLGRAVHELGDVNLRTGVSWVVQLSDLHISKWRPQRAEALKKIMGTVLGTVQPSLVLITGDLTDAKSQGGTSTQQYEEEWMTYRDFIDLMVNQSGIPLSRFYDIRGNHDKYGVPYAKSSLDYYSRYSCNARMGRTSLVQSVTTLGRDGWKHLFVGVDDSMSIGLRGPSNLFGHPSDDLIDKLDRELSQWDGNLTDPVSKIVFGHFPTSFTASSQTGRRSDQIMAKHNISAYINGHLHTKFGRHLYKHHVRGTEGEFWEWEMGDWRASRMMRVLAIDQHRVSFVDVDLSLQSKKVLRGEDFLMPTIILPTSPLDSRTMLRSSPSPAQIDDAVIRALVFSSSTPVTVLVRVLDSSPVSVSVSGDYHLVETLEMVQVSGTSAAKSGGAFLYEAAWDSRKYRDPSPTRYYLQIEVVDAQKSSTLSHLWPFSVEGKKGPFRLSFPGFIAMGFQWESFFPVVLWTIIALMLGCFLILPQVVIIYMEKRGKYDNWTLSLFDPARTSFPYVKMPVWALLEGARKRPLWLAQVAYITFLLAFPWFWGRVLSDDYPVGYMTLWGWTVWPSKGEVSHQSGVGWPDIMGIVLPFMGCVIFPFVLMVSALCAEQAACELVLAVRYREKQVRDEADSSNSGKAKARSRSGRLSRKGSGLEPTAGDDQEPLLAVTEEGASSSVASGREGTLSVEEELLESSLFNRRIRKCYFFACFAIAFLHLRLCLMMVSSYGAQAILLSPFYVWPVPVLTALCLYSTSSVKPRKLALN
ncbi:hypothetical protein R1sor_015641 [Riccia sorocarpa]|uniref:Calcineurin-like phosphoesterase domain-containing protein n=1 Tax=Riccia sorocarpa TaxID=122646 RepID=A0ABD3HFH5_9MARC